MLNSHSDLTAYFHLPLTTYKEKWNLEQVTFEKFHVIICNYVTKLTKYKALFYQYWGLLLFPHNVQWQYYKHTYKTNHIIIPIIS